MDFQAATSAVRRSRGSDAGEMETKMVLPKSALRVLTVIVAAVVALLVGGAQAMAYPSCVFDASADKKVVRGGAQVTVSSTANVDCAWTIEWNGVTRTGSGKTFSATYTAPQVSKRTVIDAHVTCTYEDTSCTGEDARDGDAARPALWTKTIPVTVLPRGGQGGPTASASGDLPNTGGPSWYLLAGGLLLLVAGAGAVRASRREPVEVDQS